jgi:hypothetical protein
VACGQAKEVSKRKTADMEMILRIRELQLR